MDQDIQDLDRCAALCTASAECVGFEMSPAGCELHNLRIKYATMNNYCTCFRKADAPVPASTADAPVLASTEAPEKTEAPAAVGSGVFVYSQVDSGCCRSTLNPDNSADSVTFYVDVIAKNVCSDLCNKDATCTAFEISNFNGCELHALVPDYASGTNGCKCFVKGEETNVLEVLEQPEVSTLEPQVLLSDDLFSKVGEGCCISAADGKPTWLTWLPGYTYSLCEYACTIDAQCKTVVFSLLHL